MLNLNNYSHVLGHIFLLIRKTNVDALIIVACKCYVLPYDLCLNFTP